MSAACCAPPSPSGIGERRAAPQFAESATLARTKPLPRAPKGMALIPGGAFLMGTEDGEGFAADGEGPVREVEISSPFYMDETAVTNAQFGRFVRAARYITEAELWGWSFVFRDFVTRRAARTVSQIVAETPWWWKVDGANWRRPEGPGSGIGRRMNHPVVHVSWNDAMAYCEWANRRLPTEAEWELAARGGLVQKRYAWGDELTPNGVHMCNIWQGEFPDRNAKDDGFASTAPARSFAPNGFGLYNVAGNVWEWQSDWFSPTFHRAETAPRRNPTGPPNGASRAIRGGSYLCHESYCNRYRAAARSANTPDSSTGNMGFRTVADVLHARN